MPLLIWESIMPFSYLDNPGSLFQVCMRKIVLRQFPPIRDLKEQNYQFFLFIMNTSKGMKISIFPYLIWTFQKRWMPPSSSFHSWNTWIIIWDTTISSKSLPRTELILQTYSIEGKRSTFRTSLLFHHANEVSWTLRSGLYLHICLTSWKQFCSSKT